MATEPAENRDGWLHEMYLVVMWPSRSQAHKRIQGELAGASIGQDEYDVMTKLWESRGDPNIVKQMKRDIVNEYGARGGLAHMKNIANLYFALVEKTSALYWQPPCKIHYCTVTMRKNLWEAWEEDVPPGEPANEESADVPVYRD